MRRWMTAGESHGPALVGILEGMPAGVEVTSDRIRSALARRRLGHGRGSRMSFEQDDVRIVGGIRHGLTQGGPIAIEIGNSEWPTWEAVMSADPVEPESLEGARGEPLTRPRPGHADLVGMTKYGFDDARPILERASARETATRVALGVVAEEFLRQAAGVDIVAHVVSVGSVSVPDDARLPEPADTEALDASPVRCFDGPTADLM
ncbi:MAG: chorismate synthase, partial [Demequinaceae bacterium]|nr:chorismate synthase [Demequinaceae bacterium]